jgi:hypothetical protein
MSVAASMSVAAGASPPGVRPTRAALAAVSAMIATLPLVAVQGPAHVTVMDGINVLVVGVYWCLVFSRRETVAWPLVVPFWMILIGSLGALYAAADRSRSLLTLTEDLYLYVWFVTVVHLLARACRLQTVAMVWVGVACTVALLTFADRYTGVLGGRLAGSARAVGTFANPNMFGNYLVVSFFVTWAAAAAGRRTLYLALVPLAGAILQTASNGAMLGLLSGCAATVAADPRRWTPRLIGPLLVVAALVVAVVGTSPEKTVNAARDALSGKRGEIGGAALKGAEERVPLWIASAQAFAASPMGVGPNNFDDSVGAILGDYHGAHSEYVGMLVERGPLGFAGWCALLGSVACALTRFRRATAESIRPLAVEPLYGVLAALTAQAVVIELFHFRHVWLLFAIICAAMVQATAGLARAASTGAARPAGAVLVEGA